MLKRLLWVICVVPLPHLLHGQQCARPVKIAQTLKAPIRQVTFLNDELLSQDKEAEIVKRVRDNTIDSIAVAKGVSSIAEEAAEGARAAYQDDGYFKVEVKAKAVRAATDKHLYDIVIRILTVGKQYRLGDLNIANATSFQTQQLRDLFPIQRDEIFSREKLAAGLEALRRLYGSQGYINYTDVPVTEFDDDNAIANLTIDADEGKQFRLRSVEVLGVDAETKARVLSDLAVKPGDIYTAQLWERSLLKFGDVAQDPDPNIVNKRLDERNGWVDMVLDFRKRPPCPIDLSVDSAITFRQTPSAEQH